MKKYVLILLVVLILVSCNHTPEKLEQYIKVHCNFENADTCYIDLSKALKIDYDTMYVFNSLTPLTGVRNIIGIKDYEKCKNPETALIGHDSEMCRIILIKNKNVVYEDEYYYSEYNAELLYDKFKIVNGKGLFDGSSIEVDGYMCANHIFKVVKTKNKYYLIGL